MKNTVSICITTKNRQTQLKDCINSIINNTVLPDEIIIVNQGSKFGKNFLNYKNTSIKWRIISQTKSNLSSGRNTAIKNSKSEILCFTDDDCIAHKDWIKNIKKRFNSNQKIIGIFGEVLPYKPKLNKHKFCPLVFKIKTYTEIKRPAYHAKRIGFGCNMAYKRSVFHEIGMFKEWLGLGSIGKSAEDAEFCLRSLIFGKSLAIDNEVKIFHNKWVHNKELINIDYTYTYGELACYGYYATKGYPFAKNIVKKALKRVFIRIKSHILVIVTKRKAILKNIDAVFKMIFLIISSLTVSIIYSFQNENKHSEKL